MSNALRSNINAVMNIKEQQLHREILVVRNKPKVAFYVQLNIRI